MDDNSKYYGTTTELQEIRKAIKYLATSVDNLVQQQKANNTQVIAEQLTFTFTTNVEKIVKDAVCEISPEPVKKDKEREALYEELNRLKKEWKYARTYHERERLRGLINSIMYELNNYY